MKIKQQTIQQKLNLRLKNPEWVDQYLDELNAEFEDK